MSYDLGAKEGKNEEKRSCVRMESRGLKGRKNGERHETEQKLGLEEEELACQVRRFFLLQLLPSSNLCNINN